ncbi:DNA-directed RNA polymerase subunit delta [Thermosyntropha sp.]|uniref:DNA-directed RNA polymerase subunit delta n=1 Tax=Thermosyntropha sp. TaxID=2740820 RepID=UPI0025E1BF5F|nr:DNA-directed RNA polymerase subunit delta [Thermosyntropha sp.]
MQRKKSETDLAVDILMENKEPMYYRDLLKEIALRMNKNDDPETITSIYTRLNLDNRLDYQGDGYWFYDTSRVRRED